MMLTNLADVVRSSGLKVIELPGWKTRGHGQMTAVEAIICHYTAGPKTGAYPSLNTVLDGRPGLDGPLAQLGLGRDLAVRVIAAGVCYHAGAVFETWQNNWHAIGIEAEATGVDPWPADMYDAYVELCAALRRGYDVPNARVLGHKEVAAPKGRKPDPNFNMVTFRARVSVAYAVKPKPNDPQEEPEMTPDQLKTVLTAVLDAQRKGDDKYEAQAESWRIAAEGLAAKMFADGAEAADVQKAVFAFLRPLWSGE